MLPKIVYFIGSFFILSFMENIVQYIIDIIIFCLSFVKITSYTLYDRTKTIYIEQIFLSIICRIIIYIYSYISFIIPFGLFLHYFMCIIMLVINMPHNITNFFINKYCNFTINDEIYL